MMITLCGSTKFMDLYHEANRRLSLAGHLVYSVAISVHGDWTPTMEEKCTLDIVHLRKIDESRAILVVTDDTDYIGESTTREIIYAKAHGKDIFFLSDPKDREQLIMGWGKEEKAGQV